MNLKKEAEARRKLYMHISAPFLIMIYPNKSLFKKLNFFKILFLIKWLFTV